MAKAVLRKTQSAAWIEMGRVVERTRTLCGLTLKEFSAAVNRGPRQVAAWIEGREQPQIAAIFAAEGADVLGRKTIRRNVVIALAERAGEGVETETIVRVKVPA